MVIEKIVFDSKDPFNSSLLYSGFKDYFLKREGIDRTSKLIYNNVLDTYLKENYDNKLENKRTVINNYLKNYNDYAYLPMFLKSSVIGLHYKNKNPKPRLFNKNNIIELSNANKTPIFVNLNYYNFKYDPNPQIFLMKYSRTFEKNGKIFRYKSPIVEGLNLHYMNIWELKKLVKLSIEFPDVNMHYFYHNVLKIYVIKKITGYKTKYAKRFAVPYHPYPKKYYANVRHFESGIKYVADDTSTHGELGKLIKTNSLLSGYRKYFVNKSIFYNVPMEIFNLK
jgi:hypothetical protein